MGSASSVRSFGRNTPHLDDFPNNESCDGTNRCLRSQHTSWRRARRIQERLRSIFDNGIRPMDLPRNARAIWTAYQSPPVSGCYGLRCSDSCCECSFSRSDPQPRTHASFPPTRYNFIESVAPSPKRTHKAWLMQEEPTATTGGKRPFAAGRTKVRLV